MNLSHLTPIERYLAGERPVVKIPIGEPAKIFNIPPP